MGQERLPKAFSAEMDASEREASKGKVPHVVEGVEQDLESVASDGSPQYRDVLALLMSCHHLATMMMMMMMTSLVVYTVLRDF